MRKLIMVFVVGMISPCFCAFGQENSDRSGDTVRAKQSDYTEVEEMAKKIVANATEADRHDDFTRYKVERVLLERPMSVNIVEVSETTNGRVAFERSFISAEYVDFDNDGWGMGDRVQYTCQRVRNNVTNLVTFIDELNIQLGELMNWQADYVRGLDFNVHKLPGALSEREINRRLALMYISNDP